MLKIDFTFVRELPCAKWKLKSLEELHASRCRSLAGEIPRDIEELSRLRVLRVGYSRIRGLPDSISTLPNLQMLDLLHCDKLHRVPKLPPTLISLSVSSKLMDTIPKIGSLVKLGELFLVDGSQELLTKLSLCCIHLKMLPWLPPGLFTLSLCQYKSRTELPDLSYLELTSEFELFDCAITELDELENLIILASLNVLYCQSHERLPNLSKLKKLKDIKIKGCPKIGDIKSMEHLHSFKKPRGAIIEAKSSSEVLSQVEFSKPANTKHSSIQGVKCKNKGSSTTWHRVKAVASKFSCQMISRTKPTHSFPH
ncbi:hypothetical protein EUGRSUZ_C02072 [Eucalyptus grandis]|uniref:Uncharacterized protein n=2 Tax=Eucalyptus grandis TaxID=71139 RepID=A0ACC3LF47_EUCGR|nr:hypothetical protein EUGRSUZ_C02072 [Eucalyptus grandis]